MKFEPWKEFAENIPKLRINVPEPPCKHCHFWKPRIKTDQFGDYDGVVLCAKIGGQCNDFSCYVAKLPGESVKR